MKDLKLDEHTGLVLEGGGMRGVFTCGVLDYLMDRGVGRSLQWFVVCIPPAWAC